MEGWLLSKKLIMSVLIFAIQQTEQELGLQDV